VNADFRKVWRQLIGSSAPDSSEHRSIAGYSGRMAVTSTDRIGYLQIYLLQADGAAIPIAVWGSTPGSVFNHSAAVEPFLDSVRVGHADAAIPKKRVMVSDLIGEWHHEADGSVPQTSPSGIVVSRPSAHGKTYKIAPDGTCTFTYAGIFGGIIVREEHTGTVEMERDLITFRDKKKNYTDTYRVISLQLSPSGTTVLTVLEPQYDPISANIRAYGEKWFRSAAPATARR